MSHSVWAISTETRSPSKTFPTMFSKTKCAVRYSTFWISLSQCSCDSWVYGGEEEEKKKRKRDYSFAGALTMLWLWKQHCFNCAIMYALQNKYSAHTIWINYYSNESRGAEKMIRLKETELAANSSSDEWLGGMNREVLIKANIVSQHCTVCWWADGEP